MKARSLFSFGMSLVLWGAGTLPVFAQSQETEVQIASTNNTSKDTAAIFELVRGWGRIEYIIIIENYANVDYSFGANGAHVILKRQDGRWKIIDSAGRFSNDGENWVENSEHSCHQDINCLVDKGVPRNIATQLLDPLALERYSDRQNQELQSFRQAWSRSNRNIAPFLGYWPNMNWPITTKDIAISIWPSYTPNRVCVVGIGDRYQYVNIGVVSGNSIKTQNETFSIAQESNYTENIESDKHWLIRVKPLNT